MKKKPLFHTDVWRRELKRRQRQQAKQKQSRTTKRGKRKASTPGEVVLERVNPEDFDYKRLKKAVQNLARSVSRNVRNLVDYLSVTQEAQSPALSELLSSGGLLSTKGTFEELFGEYLRGTTFMQNPTHTVTGYKKWNKEMLETLSARMPSFNELSLEEQQNRTEQYWRAFSRLKQKYPWILAAQALTSSLINDTKERCLNDLSMGIDEMLIYMENYIGENSEEAEKGWELSTPGTYQAAETEMQNLYTYVKPYSRVHVKES